MKTKLVIRNACKYSLENPAYGRHRISRPMRIVGPIKFWRVCVIYLEKKEEEKWAVDASTRPRVQASARPHDGSTRGRWMLCTHPPFLGLHTCNKMGSTPVLPHKIRQNQHKKDFFYAAILDHFPIKMFNSETTSFQHFSPRIPNLQNFWTSDFGKWGQNRPQNILREKAHK